MDRVRTPGLSMEKLPQFIGRRVNLHLTPPMQKSTY